MILHFLFLFLCIVAEEVAILALALGINKPVLVLALGGKATPSIQVVAVVAHAFCVVLCVFVGAPGVLPLLTSRLFTRGG